MGDSTVALVNTSDLFDLGGGMQGLPSTTMQSAFNVCPSEPFAGQPVPGFCSGFLVAPDIIATAGHCIRNSTECDNTAFVFGFVMQNANTPVLSVPSEEIYYCTEIIAREEFGNGADWALIHVDREVDNHVPLSFRQEGKVPNNAPLIVIGHPSGLPRKYAGGANVRDNNPVDHFVANLDTYGGNSGSAVFNQDTLQVEGILVRGEADFVNNGGCLVSNQCSDSGCLGEDCTRTTAFADFIPRTTYDVKLAKVGHALQLVCEDVEENVCDPGILDRGALYQSAVA